MIVDVVDYGAGNVTSVMRALAAVGSTPRRATSPAGIERAAALVIPGVGHFSVTARLGTDWRAAIARAVDAGIPLLGICLGMQWLYAGSEEAPACAGLGIFEGRCSSLPVDLKLPHVGWNSSARSRPSRLLDGLNSPVYTYFTHTFAAPMGDDASAVAEYGRPFAASVERGRVFGTQWHPEKSGAAGRRVLANFVAIAAETV